MPKPSLTKQLATHSIAISLILATCPLGVNAKEYNAICSYYSEYTPCNVKINNGTVTANLPTDLLLLNKHNFLDLVIYEDLHKPRILWSVQSLHYYFDQLDYLDFWPQPGTIDYAFKFKSDDGRRRPTDPLQNLKVAGKFGQEISSMLPN